MRDDTLEHWRSELELAAGIAGDQRALASCPTRLSPSSDVPACLATSSADRVSQPVLNLVQLMLRRGRIEELPRVASEFRRLDDERQGITHATATSAAEL